MITDPMERLIADALEAAGEPFERESPDNRLDFRLTDRGIHIEVKQFHSDRIAAQMASADNVIVAQGRPAVEYLAKLIACGLPLTPPETKS